MLHSWRCMGENGLSLFPPTFTFSLAVLRSDRGMYESPENYFQSYSMGPQLKVHGWKWPIDNSRCYVVTQVLPTWNCRNLWEIAQNPLSLFLLFNPVALDSDNFVVDYICMLTIYSSTTWIVTTNSSCTWNSFCV